MIMKDYGICVLHNLWSYSVSFYIIFLAKVDLNLISWRVILWKMPIVNRGTDVIWVDRNHLQSKEKGKLGFWEKKRNLGFEKRNRSLDKFWASHPVYTIGHHTPKLKITISKILTGIFNFNHSIIIIREVVGDYLYALQKSNFRKQLMWY